jgi:hypothetical protein
MDISCDLLTAYKPTQDILYFCYKLYSRFTKNMKNKE